jgi:hypothetical protein
MDQARLATSHQGALRQIADLDSHLSGDGEGVGVPDERTPAVSGTTTAHRHWRVPLRDVLDYRERTRRCRWVATPPDAANKQSNRSYVFLFRFRMRRTINPGSPD